MSTEYELFKGKSLSSLFEDIYNNSKHNKHQLEVLVKEVTSFIKDGDIYVQLIPMIKEYLEINVKNDEQLVKLCGIVQRIIPTKTKVVLDPEFGLSDREKEQLLKSIDDVVVDLQTKTDEITQDIEEVKETKWVIGQKIPPIHRYKDKKTIYDKDGSGVLPTRSCSSINKIKYTKSKGLGIL